MSSMRLFANQTFRSLDTRNFRLFFLGQLTSQIGTWMQSISIILVVNQLTHNGFALGVATAAQYLPVLILGAWGGVISDRVDRHRFMIATQCAFLVVALGFTGLAFTHHLTLPFIYALSITYGVITALDNPSRRALVVELVDERDVPNAVSLNSALMTGSRVVGPAAAGAIFATIGVAWAFAINAASFVAILAGLLAMDRTLLRRPPVVAKQKGQMVEGLRHVRDNVDLRLSFILLTVIGTLAFEYQVSLPLLAERSLHGGPGTFTLLYSLMGVGSVVGALAVARRTEVRTTFLAQAAVWLGIASLGLTFAPNVWSAAVIIVPMGFAMVMMMTGSNTVIQLMADPRMRGRVLSFTAIVFIGSTPIGGPIVGAIADRFGARSGVGIGAVASLLVGLWVLRELRKLERRSAAEVAVAGTVAVPPGAAAGPAGEPMVVTTVADGDGGPQLRATA